MTLEIRAGSPVEVRKDDSKINVSGYAAVFNSEANIGGVFIEKIERGAFSEAVKNDDVVFLVNHEGLPLARTKSGTLKISEDDHGLKIETELDERDPDVQKIKIKMERGDLDKMSFAFYPEVQEWDESGDIPVRTIKKASLNDVSIVNFPAYDSTEIGLRSLQEYRSTQTQEQSMIAIKARMRMNLALAK